MCIFGGYSKISKSSYGTDPSDCSDKAPEIPW